MPGSRHYKDPSSPVCLPLLEREPGSARQCWPVIVQEGCEFLVAQGSDGRLNLDDVYVYDEETGIYARPDKVGDMPPGPRLFQQVAHICVKLWSGAATAGSEAICRLTLQPCPRSLRLAFLRDHVPCEQVPWRHESTGDTVYAKDPVEQVPGACTAPHWASTASGTVPE